ncbi:MAG: PD-(D/E)XK nuclease family protein [Maribacter sp.]|nr:PD-(D/E)XK nuclease family protein [Maribacter sp.]
MQSFIEGVVTDILENRQSIEDIVFVLPSKRSGHFLKKAIAQSTNRTLFAPEIYSIEGFIEKLSGIRYATNTQLLFELYGTYLKTTPGEKDNFYTFSKWGQTLLQDFNEIDRHLIDPTAIFSNLSSIQELSIWSPEAKKTPMMENYLKFWKGLKALYYEFNKNLMAQGLGYQGLVYRQAWINLVKYQELNQKSHVFIGFNALNTAESQIIQQMLTTAQADIYWDLDVQFLEDPVHDAAYFIRKYNTYWHYFKENPLKGISDHYASRKKIQIIGVPKYISQAKYVGNLLKEIHRATPEALENSALVLGDETLLNPILNAIPPEIKAVNITMGYPLKNTLLAGMFEQFIDLYLNIDAQGWYHQNITEFLAHPSVYTLLANKKANVAAKIIAAIKQRNLTYLGAEKLKSLFPQTPPEITLLFFEESATPVHIVERCLHIIKRLKNTLEGSGDSLQLEYLYRFHTLFNQILDLLETTDFITDLKSLRSLYRELLMTEKLDFQGDPLEGLQIMGMLESRNLDFETVIITSVNEGILPSGKSNNSFLPFDLKLHYGLPTYKEKDAVYTYHFYRLLQRAKNIYLIYNTEPDVLEGGERSRLITQLLTDGNKKMDITEIIATPTILPTRNVLQLIEKDPELIHLIKDHAARGFSPSSLSTYIRNPIDFYKLHILGIEESLQVEENLAANTFGTIVHDTLEDLYTPLIGDYLTLENLRAMKPKVRGLINHHFEKNYQDSNLLKGKNLIALNVMVKYIENFIDLELAGAESHQIKIMGLEKKLKIQLDLPELDYPVYLKGKIDRIDMKDGELRIIDYKTGKVEPKNVVLADWDNLIVDYDYSKAFQLLCYALLYQTTNGFDKAEAGIITFKNLNAGLLRFALKDQNGGRSKDTTINSDVLKEFSLKLNALITEIGNPHIGFTEKEV